MAAGVGMGVGIKGSTRGLSAAMEHSCTLIAVLVTGIYARDKMTWKHTHTYCTNVDFSGVIPIPQYYSNRYDVPIGGDWEKGTQDPCTLFKFPVTP